MSGIIRGIVFALAGFTIFECFRVSLAKAAVAGKRRDAGERLGRAAAGGASLTGPGRGMRQTTLDLDGQSASHVVGRGVVA